MTSKKKSEVGIIIPAAGSGSRLKADKPKALVQINKAPILVWAIRSLRSHYPKAPVWLAIQPSMFKSVAKMIKTFNLSSVYLVEGGKERADSVFNAFKCAADAASVVLVHDAARPFTSAEPVRSLVVAAKKYGGAILAEPASSTVKEAAAKGKEVLVAKTLDRSRIYLAQTPQAFVANRLAAAYKKVNKRSIYTDEASLYEAAGGKVALVCGSSKNFKITTPEDLQIAETAFQALYYNRRSRARGK